LLRANRFLPQNAGPESNPAFRQRFDSALQIIAATNGMPLVIPAF
jgi:hypothetical protein